MVVIEMEEQTEKEAEILDDVEVTQNFFRPFGRLSPHNIYGLKKKKKMQQPKISMSHMCNFIAFLSSSMHIFCFFCLSHSSKKKGYCFF